MSVCWPKVLVEIEQVRPLSRIKMQGICGLGAELNLHRMKVPGLSCVGVIIGQRNGNKIE